MSNNITSTAVAREALTKAFPNITDVGKLDHGGIYWHRDAGLLKFLEYIQTRPEYAEMRNTVTTPQELDSLFYSFRKTFSNQHFVDKFYEIKTHAEFVLWQLSLPTPFGDCGGYYLSSYSKYMFSDVSQVMSKSNCVKVSHRCVDDFRKVLETRISCPDFDVNLMAGNTFWLDRISVSMCADMLEKMKEGYVPLSCVETSMPMFNYMATTLKSFNDPVCAIVNKELMDMYTDIEIPSSGMYAGLCELNKYTRIAVGLILKAIAMVFDENDDMSDDCCPDVMTVCMDTSRYTYNHDPYDREGDLNYKIIALKKHEDASSDDCDIELYAMVQSHNGADARGGFTLPFLYKLNDHEEHAVDVHKLNGVDLQEIGPSHGFGDEYSNMVMLDGNMKVVSFATDGECKCTTIGDLVDMIDLIPGFDTDTRVRLADIESVDQSRVFVQVQDVIDAIIL